MLHKYTEAEGFELRNGVALANKKSEDF